MPGPKQPSRSAASGCSASVYRPIAAPSRLPSRTRPPRPTAPAGTPRPGTVRRPAENAAFFSLSARLSLTRPSRPRAARSRTPPSPRPPPSARPRALTASAPYQRPASPGPATARRVRQPPWRPCPRPPVLPAPAARPAGPRPAARRTARLPAYAITWPYPQFRPRNSHNASTKYTISRAGSSPRRCSRVPVTSMISSTNSAERPVQYPVPRSVRQPAVRR